MCTTRYSRKGEILATEDEMVAKDLEGGRMPRQHVDIFQGSRAPLYDATVESISHQSTGHVTVRVSSEVRHGIGVDNDGWKPMDV